MITLLSIALFNAYLMGFHGSAAVVATVIASRALSPRRALALTALAAFGGPLVLGAAVANTIGQGLIWPSAWSTEALACGLLAASGWTLLTWWVGLPCSASQALIGGLLGAATVAAGPGAVQPAGALKTLIGLFVSPPVGLLAGVLLMRLTLWLAQSATPRANNLFKRLQVITSLTLALTVSANDAQKVMGVMTLILMLTGDLSVFVTPLWIKVLAAGAFALGILSGGYRLIRTLGGRLVRVRPIHAFVAQFATTGVILLASQTGLPVSSTQLIGTAIVGVGSAERLSKVRWQVAATMVTAWLMTIPVTAILAGLGVWLWRS